MKQMFADKGYEPDTFDVYAEAVERHQGIF